MRGNRIGDDYTKTEYSGFGERLSELQEKNVEVKGMIKDLDRKNMQYKNAVKYLVSCNKNLPVFNELQKRVFDRKKFEERHGGELAEFRYAAAQLEKMGVNPAVDPDKVLNLVADQNQKVSDLENVGRRIDSIRKARDIVEQIQTGIQDPGRQQQQHAHNNER